MCDAARDLLQQRRARVELLGQPPISANSLPSRTCGIVPSTGESMSCAPRASTTGASSRPVIGCNVLISMNSLPLTSVVRKPSDPVKMRRTP